MASMPPFSATASSRPSTISWMRPVSSRMRLAVKALLTSVRRRVWSGGSEPSMVRGAPSPACCGPRCSPDRLEPLGLRGEPEVLVLGEVDVGGGGVGLELLDARRARDSDDVRPPDDPGEGHLRRAASLGQRNVAHRLDETTGALEVL